MALAIPPLNLWPTALLALFPLLWAGARRGARIRRDVVAAGLGVIPLWAFVQFWVLNVSALGYYPMVLGCALFPGLFVGAVALLTRRWPRLPLCLITPLAWTALEFFRGEIAFHGYAWEFTVHPLIEAPALASPAAVGGVYLVSALVACGVGAVADVLRRRWWCVGVLATVVGAFVASWWVQPGAASDSVSVAVVQTNVPQDNKLDWEPSEEERDIEAFAGLTRRAAEQKPDFIVWPETMAPGPTLEPESMRALAREKIVYTLDTGREIPVERFYLDLLALQQASGCPLVVGEEAWTRIDFPQLADGRVAVEPIERRNSVYVIDAGRVGAARYDKMRLTPFGETIPYLPPAWRDAVSDFAAHGMRLDLAAGTSPTVLTVRRARSGGECRIATPICFEATAADVCRKLVFAEGRRRADLLVNVTNDGWFGDFDPARWQHIQLARWRCVELATPMVRAANTGVSCVIDARGRMLKTGIDGSPAGVRVEGVMTADVPLCSALPLTARVGDAPGWVVFAGGASLMLVALFKRRHNTPETR